MLICQAHDMPATVKDQQLYMSLLACSMPEATVRATTVHMMPTVWKYLLLLRDGHRVMHHANHPMVSLMINLVHAGVVLAGYGCRFTIG